MKVSRGLGASSWLPVEAWAVASTCCRVFKWLYYLFSQQITKILAFPQSSDIVAKMLHFAGLTVENIACFIFTHF